MSYAWAGGEAQDSRNQPGLRQMRTGSGMQDMGQGGYPPGPMAQPGRPPEPHSGGRQIRSQPMAGQYASPGLSQQRSGGYNPSLSQQGHHSSINSFGPSQGYQHIQGPPQSGGYRQQPMMGHSQTGPAGGFWGGGFNTPPQNHPPPPPQQNGGYAIPRGQAGQPFYNTPHGERRHPAPIPQNTPRENSQHPWGPPPGAVTSSAHPVPQYGIQERSGVRGTAAQPSVTKKMSLASLDKEIKLFDNHQMEQQYKAMADLFAVIKAVEHLERAYRRGSINESIYTEECWKLVNQYKATKDTISDVVPDTRRFMEEYNIHAPAARRRLLEVKVPSTVEFGERGGQVTENESLRVAQAVHNFITATDSIRLNMTAVDQLQPFVLDVLEQLNKIEFVSPEFEGKVKLKGWLTKFNSMKASDNLSENDTRQLLFDLESSYNAFHRLLENQNLKGKH